MEDDPVAWQLEQIDQLKKLAAAMGWKESSPQYKFELKRIHLKAKGGDDAAAAVEVKKEVKMTWPPFKGWVHGASGTFKDKDAARVGLLVKLHAGKWINDKGCPNSEAEDGRKAWRQVNKSAVGGPYLARLVDVDGTGKKWRVDTPKWVEEEDEEDEEEKKKPEPESKSKRGRGEEGEAGGSETAAPATEEAAVPPPQVKERPKLRKKRVR